MDDALTTTDDSAENAAIVDSSTPAGTPAGSAGRFARFAAWRRNRRQSTAARFAREEPLRAAFFRQVIFVCAGALVVQGALLLAAGVAWGDLVWTTLEPAALIALAGWCSLRRRGLLATLLLLVALCHAAAFTQARFANVAVLGVLLALTIPLSGMLVGASFVRIWTLICCGVMIFILVAGKSAVSEPWPNLVAWCTVYLALAWLVELFSRHLERLYEVSRTAEAQRHEAIVNERTRFARDIHDTLAQGFTGIVMQLNAAEQRLPAENSAARTHLEKARQLARESLEEARRSVLALRPHASAPGDLPHAIASIGQKLALPPDVHLECKVTGQRWALPEADELQLLRIAQEGLTNAARHSGATRIVVRVDYGAGAVRLEIEDNGCGIRGDAPAGMGLKGMRERVGRIGGRISFEPRPAGGTCVVVTYPHD